MYFKIEYENGYCGCDVTKYLEADSLEIAEQIGQEGVDDYAQEYEHCAEGCDFEEGWESDEAEETYYENIYYSVTEITKEEYDENK